MVQANGGNSEEAMADENIPKIDENADQGSDRAKDQAEGDESSGKKKLRFKIVLPLGLTPLLLGIALLALGSAYLSVSSLMKTGVYRQQLDVALMAARDPGNLCHYRAANSKILSSDAFKPARLFVLYGSDFGADWDMLRALREENVINRSIPHQNMTQLFIRFEQDVLELQPRAFIILPSIETMEKPKPELIKVRIMCDLAANLGVEPVLVKLPPIPADQDLVEGGYRGRIMSYNRGIDEIATDTGWQVLDLFTPLANDEYYLKTEHSSSDLWPNPGGYHVITDMLKEMVGDLGSYQFANSSRSNGTAVRVAQP
jgi:hypothetical protein